jgi:hypothetical protein
MSSGYIAPPILEIGIRVSGQLHFPVALSPEVNLPVALEQEAGWVTEPVWTL